MNQFERDLREALQHEEPPADLADKVLAKTRSNARNHPARAWLAAAALLVLMIGGIAFVQEQRREAEREKAKQELVAGLRIMGMKIRDVQERLSTVRERIVQPGTDQ